MHPQRSQDEERTTVRAATPAPPAATDTSTPADQPPLPPEIEAAFEASWAEYEEAYRYLGSH